LNLQIGITHQLRGKLEEPGESTVDAKIISDYVNLLPAEKIELKEFEDGIDIKCGNYKTKIKGESSKEFPLIPLIDKDKFCELNIFDFRKALNSVAFAVANNDNRMELSGVFFQFQDNLGQQDKRYVNVCVDHTDFKPITFQEIIEKIS
jgi:DNA polymerase-3 subunit beta